MHFDNLNCIIKMIGVSDYARVFHPVAVSLSTNEDESMFHFIGK
jgi:hypothetical protein